MPSRATHHTTHTTQHNTTQHNTTQHNTTQHNTTQHTPQHNTTQHNTTHTHTPHNTTTHNRQRQKERDRERQRETEKERQYKKREDETIKEKKLEDERGETRTCGNTCVCGAGTHWDVLNPHTGRQGVIVSSAYQKFAHVGSSLGPRGPPKKPLDLTDFQFENRSRATRCRFLQTFAVPDKTVQFTQ